MEFDYIIVGSGAGGSVLASRLSADRGSRVLILEAGASDRGPVHRVPKGFAFTMTDPKFTTSYVTEPSQPGSPGDTWFRGRVVGGSTTINGLVWNRGWRPDFDRLEAEGNSGWGWQTFLGAYRDLENFRAGVPTQPGLHGRGGPVDVEMALPAEEVCEAFLGSAAAVGMPRTADVNGSDDDRAGYAQFSTRRGLRVSASSAHLRPSLRRDNLTLVTGATVQRILFEGKRAVGVLVDQGGRRREYRAAREVLVSAGALESPLLLERSGIGRGDVLQAAGIEQRVESPNVGERMSEHRGLRFMYQVKGAKGFNHQVNSQRDQLLTGAKFLLTRRGIIAQGSASVLTYFSAHHDATRPDAIGFFSPMSTKTATLHDKKLATADEPGMMVAVYPLRPTSQGSIHLPSAGAGPTPVVTANFLSTDYDRALIVAMARRMRELFASGPVARLVDAPLSPACEMQDDDELVQHALTAGASGYHTLGTCAMGPNDADVVDSELKVRGVEGLRVVDASVFPHQPSGNTSAPTQALAWHAARLILADA
ncbi:GMC oxidoreductase (plasmid) [Mycolicibacterium madagascariense]|uniref:GMC oxidoreductase n=1 Tax=Mycolicibacterium madagascariense TaxID=212765 RepID=A0A7I7XQ30_9MYCO|nr:GMC family oxidoreductase N-terminal domain-containing protein [Mycolicibacterium madagascariense]BBZ31244.1 GMC oxidoreductase [Mycolicibacterium madagascariense]